MISDYLYKLTGEYSNEKRREIRKIFQTGGLNTFELSNNDITLESNFDIIVGVLLEYQQIGIKKFNIQQIYKTIEIFGLVPKFKGENVMDILYKLCCHPKIRLQHDDHGHFFVPDLNRLEHLHLQFLVER